MLSAQSCHRKCFNFCLINFYAILRASESGSKIDTVIDNLIHRLETMKNALRLIQFVTALVIGFQFTTLHAVETVAKVTAPSVEKSLDGSVASLAEAEFNEENIETEIFENENIAQDAVKEKIRLINETKKVDQELSRTQSKLQQSKRSSHHAQTQLNKTQAKYDNLVRKHNSKIDELKNLEAKIKQQHQVLSRAESKLNGLVDVHGDLNDGLSEARSLSADLKKRRSFAERQIVHQRQKNKTMKSQLSKLQSENKKLSKQVSKLESQVR